MKQPISIMLITLCGCIPLPTPDPAATPEPCPTPTPPPKPAPGILNAPDVVPINAAFPVTLCKPYTPNTTLYIDSYKLGTFGHHRPTGCMLLLVPGLNTPGDRVLKVGDLARPITVFGQQDVK